MDKHEHTLRKSLRTTIEQAMTASLSVGDAVEVAVMAAEVFSTAIRGGKEGQVYIYVVSWPDPSLTQPHQPVIRQARGFFEEELALRKANSLDGAEIFKLEVV